MSEPSPWWEKRREELLSLAGAGPVCVYNGESVNDTVFDLLSLEQVGGLLHRMGSNPHPGVIEAMARQGAHFLLNRPGEFDILETVPLIPDSAAIVFEHQRELLPLSRDKVSLEVVLATLVPEYIEHNPDYFASRRVLLALPGPGFPEGPLALSRLIGTLSSLGAHVCGFYLPWGEGHEVTRATAGALRDHKRIFDPMELLVLGKGLGISFDADSGRVDPERTSETLSVLLQAGGSVTLWLEPGRSVLSSMAVFLFPVVGAVESGGKTFVTVQENAFNPCLAACKGRVPDLINLNKASSPWKKKGILHQVNDASVSLPCTLSGTPEPGDILLMPRFYRERGPTDRGTPSPCGVREHYLNARRICQVPI